MLGGGNFTAQNKILPGAYINVVSASRAASVVGDRGVVALPLELDWGVENTVFSVTAEDFRKNALALFGYPAEHEKLRGLRDLFRGARMARFYRLNGGGTAASNTFATACVSGRRGDDLKIVITTNEASEGGTQLFDVATMMDTRVVDLQKAASTTKDLKPNSWVRWNADVPLALTAGTPLSGGSNGEVTAQSYQAAIDALESYSFNILGCPSQEAAIKGLFAAYTRRMRDELGVKFQSVLHRYEQADYEGVVSVENNDTPELVCWVCGALAGCALNEDTSNLVYDGEFAVETAYTQADLEAALQAGKYILHRQNEDVRVLEDINTLVTYTDEKSADFANNQVVRVIDQTANDIGALFNTKYLGRVANDDSGRVSLWSDIVSHHQLLQDMRAIQDFNPDSVVVGIGDSAKAVEVQDVVQPILAMKQLYLTLLIS